MTLKKLNSELKKVGVPVAYLNFKKSIKMPFIVYQEIGTNNEGADNTVFCEILRIQIDLYQTTRDFEIEEKLEKILSNIAFWNKEQTPLEDEQCFRWTYYIEIEKG